MKEFLVAHAAEAIAAITAVGVFVGPWFASWRHRRNTEQDRKLKTHFEELKIEAKPLISLASNLALMSANWKVVVSQGKYGENVSDFEKSEVSPDFGAHFPEQARELSRLKQETSEHNTNCEDFRRKIIETLESKGISVEQNSQRTLCTCIYEAVFDPLFAVWGRLAQNERPWVNFQEINSRQVEGGYLLYASGWGASAVAFAKAEDDLEKCKSALAGVADDMENQNEAARILASANELKEKAKGFADQLNHKLDDIDKFWRGKKTKEFKKLKKTCPTCKELF